jgi:hypothetical protein
MNYSSATCLQRLNLSEQVQGNQTLYSLRPIEHWNSSIETERIYRYKNKRTLTIGSLQQAAAPPHSDGRGYGSDLQTRETTCEGMEEKGWLSSPWLRARTRSTCTFFFARRLLLLLLLCAAAGMTKSGGKQRAEERPYIYCDGVGF